MGLESANQQAQLNQLAENGMPESVEQRYPASAIVQINPLYINDISRLSIGFDDYQEAISSVFLVADSYALIPVQPNEDNSFSIPLPSWRKADRAYTLMAFTQIMDASDRQSLAAYLKSLHADGLAPDANNLSTWANQQKLSVSFVQQRLLLTKQ